MRLLIWHCKSLEYVDRRPANRPADVHQTPPRRHAASFDDVMLAFTTIERHDALPSVMDASEAIVSLTRQCEAQQGCVVMPFAHLSRDLAPPHDARSLLAALRSAIAEAGCPVDLASFGFHKDLSLNFAAIGHPGSVAFREF